MKTLRALLALVPFFVIAALMVVANDRVSVEEIDFPTPGTGDVCQPSERNNWCAPVDHPGVLAAVADLEAKGLTCSAASDLTDHIVFQHRESLAVEVVTFDRALELVGAKAGWLQSYCSSN